jgi:hypothetical protein
MIEDDAWDDDDFYDDDDEPYEPGFDCHMDKHGLCDKAGSEECDWDCPYLKD